MANPMYRQIAEDLREQIESGKLAPGQQLPTEIELRESYNASRNTVRDAIKWLTTLGWSRPVRARAPSSSRRSTRSSPRCRAIPDRFRWRRRRQLPVGSEQAGQETCDQPDPGRDPESLGRGLHGLEIPKGTEVISRHERRFIDGTPWSMQTSFYPIDFADRGAERLRSARDIEEGTVRYLADTLASTRRVIATGSPCGRRTRPRPTSSSCLRMAGSRYRNLQDRL